MNILGISCWYHDSAAVLLQDGSITAASEEERFSRKKHDFGFPVNSIAFCLEQAGIKKADINYVVFYDKPFVKFDRIITSVIEHAPRSAGVFREAIPLWLTKKLKFRKKVRKELGIREENILFCSHHLSHAASSFLVSPFDEAAIVTVDGVGEWATATIGTGRGNKVDITHEMLFPHSLGLLYSAFTAFLGFKINNGEYKVMGMAPYGEPKHVDKVYKVVSIGDDGSIIMNREYFSYEYSIKKTYTDSFVRLFGKPRDPDSLFFTHGTEFPAYYGDKPEDYDKLASENQYYADIAASIQHVLEDALIKTVRFAMETTGMKKLCYAGGVALNSKANFRLLSETGLEDIFIQPAATDAGGALGAALWCWCGLLDKGRPEPMVSNYLGKAFSESEIKNAVEDSGFRYEVLDDERIFDKVTDAIIGGKVIAWYNSRTEWGPRALGNRSIIADPRNPDMKNRVNTVIKFREPYRPFAPSILEEDVDVYIKREKPLLIDRFMLVTYPVKEEAKKILPAVTHVNGTSRIQEVSKSVNPRYWGLIKKFKDKTGVGVLLNTSFNLRGEPIVNSPADAVKTFSASGIDILVMNDRVLYKET